MQRQQQTIKRSVSYTGIGLHTGEIVTLSFHPAKPDSGVILRRVDLPNSPVIPATVDYVTATDRNTTLGSDGVKIFTVEHVLAAVAALQVDNLVIELDNIEPPIANGSSDLFCELLLDAQVVEQGVAVEVRKLETPLYYSEGEIQLIALPSDRYRLTYVLSYPSVPYLESQFYTSEITPEKFVSEIAPCRSFGLMSEITPLLSRGLIKGCSLSNAVVVDGDVVFSKDGLFFPNEMARHKVLDMVGDLSLVGFPFCAHVIGIRSGHATHRHLAFALREALLQGVPTR